VTARSRWIADLRWVRAGRQPRSQRTQESLLDAAAVLFSEKGVDATSVADVAARAGCSVGAVYHHFRDKGALLHAVFDRMAEELRSTTREAVEPSRWEGASIGDVLRGYLEFSLAIGRDRPVSKRAAALASRSDPALRERYAGLRAEMYEALTGLLLARRDEVGHPDPVLAIGFVLDQLGSMLQTRLDDTMLPTQLAGRSDEQFVREALRSACAYLRVPPPANPEEER
jgi:AcrR family transcriptional regulator